MKTSNIEGFDVINFNDEYAGFATGNHFEELAIHCWPLIAVSVDHFLTSKKKLGTANVARVIFKYCRHSVAPRAFTRSRHLFSRRCRGKLRCLTAGVKGSTN